MFTKDSRYSDTQVVSASVDNREVAAVKLRALPDTAGEPMAVAGADQLDVIADRCYQDGARFWHIADANTELDARDILKPVGRIVKVPER